MMNTSIPAHSLYGRPAVYQLSADPDAPLAAASREYVGRGNKCLGNDDTCNAAPMRNSDLCYGHNRRAAAEERETEDI